MTSSMVLTFMNYSVQRTVFNLIMTVIHNISHKGNVIKLYRLKALFSSECNSS